MTIETVVPGIKPMIPTTEGCFVDPNALFLSPDGTTVELLEWAPDAAHPARETFGAAQTVAKNLTLAGGGWKVPSPKEWVASGINYAKEELASDLPDAKIDWYWTDQVDASSPSDSPFYVYLHYGNVYWNSQSLRGRVRFCRRVRASQYLILGS